MDITSLVSKSSYCIKGAPQQGKSELCPCFMHVMTDAYGSLHFSAIFLHFSAIMLIIL